MLLSFCPYVGTWRFLWWCILILWHVYFGDVWILSATTVEEFYICLLFEFLCEDVASISWIYALFACFIALIEIGRYRCPFIVQGHPLQVVPFCHFTWVVHIHMSLSYFILTRIPIIGDNWYSSSLRNR